MAVAHDAATKGGAFTGAGPYTVNHTPGAQFARPDADVAAGDWTTAPLWSKLDDNDDADFIQDTAPIGAFCEVGLSNVTDPGLSSGHVLRVRARVDGVTGFDTAQARVRLQQGGTTKATLTSSNLTDAFATYTYTLSAAEADSITDYSDLSLEIEGVWTDGIGLNPRVDVAWVELQVPGAPRGVLMLAIAAGTGASTDRITGVTYGGVAMTRVATNGHAADGSGELGSAYMYHLGASIPGGAQDCAVSIDGAPSANMMVLVATVTATADTEVSVSGKLEADQADPQIALDSSTASALRYCAIFSGLPTVTNLTVLADMSAVDSHDFGSNIGRWDRQTTAGTGSFTIGYTGTIDDVAMGAVAIKEVAGGSTVTLTPSTETDTAQALTAQKVVSLSPVAETDGAQTLSFHKVATLSPALETDSAQALVAQKVMSLAVAAETDGAQPLSFHKVVSLSPALETDEAQVLVIAGAPGGSHSRSLLGVGQ